MRLAALVAVGGPGPSFRAEADAAISAGATAGEIVDVLVGVTGVVGLPSVVAAAPRLALALGYDIDDALERTRPWSDYEPPMSPSVVARSTASLREDTPSLR